MSCFSFKPAQGIYVAYKARIRGKHLVVYTIDYRTTSVITLQYRLGASYIFFTGNDSTFREIQRSAICTSWSPSQRLSVRGANHRDCDNDVIHCVGDYDAHDALGK